MSDSKKGTQENGGILVGLVYLYELKVCALILYDWWKIESRISLKNFLIVQKKMN